MSCKNIFIDEEVICVFIPPDDDTFACLSHHCLAAIETPNGMWLFSKPLTEPSGNTPQNDRKLRT